MQICKPICFSMPFIVRRTLFIHHLRAVPVKIRALPWTAIEGQPPPLHGNLGPWATTEPGFPGF